MLKHGQYMYSEGGRLTRKFGDRTLTILISDAYNAGGLIGSEVNGIAIIDEDARQVVLDRHMPQDSGSSGPSWEQKREFERLCAMDWAELTAFCRAHPRFRGGVADDIATPSKPAAVDRIEQLIVEGKLGNEGPDIRTPEMIEAHEKTDIPFPLKTREDMIVWLARHDMYGDHNCECYLAWNIKVRNLDTSGRNGEDETDSQFDERWAKLVESDPEMFWEACRQGLSEFLDGDYTTYPGDDQGAQEFHTAGRSGGHLCLAAWCEDAGGKRVSMKFDSREGYIEWLKELPPERLAAFYKLVANVDHDVAEPGKKVAYQLGCIRAMKEQEWRQELDEDAAAEEDCVQTGMMP